MLPILVLLLHAPRIAGWLYNPCCLIPRPMRCGELYILRKRPIRGRTHLAPLHRASIWSGPCPVSNSLFANASTILPSFLIISTCWSSLSLMIVLVMVPECGNLTLPSWMIQVIVLLSLPFGPFGNHITHQRPFPPFFSGGIKVNFTCGR